MKVLRLEGNVFSGADEGKKYVRLAWVKRQVEEKLGFTPYMGTLNIRLSGESIRQKKVLTRESTLEIVPAAGYCRGKLFKAILNDIVDGAVVIPDLRDYPDNILEVISSENLRKKLQLNDGDRVEIEIIL